MVVPFVAERVQVRIFSRFRFARIRVSSSMVWMFSTYLWMFSLFWASSLLRSSRPILLSCSYRWE